jgi:hypothetical protein
MTFSVQGFLHGSMKIGECSLKQWLPINHIAELVAIKFEAVHPGNGQLDPRYRKHHTIIKKFPKSSLSLLRDLVSSSRVKSFFLINIKYKVDRVC